MARRGSSRSERAQMSLQTGCRWPIIRNQAQLIHWSGSREEKEGCGRVCVSRLLRRALALNNGSNICLALKGSESFEVQALIKTS